MPENTPAPETRATDITRPRWSLPRGRLLRRALRNDSSSEYLTYVPRLGSFEAPVFVAVHGWSRNWDEHAQAFAQLCEIYGVVLLAPNFSTEQHKDFQRLGRLGRGERADLFLNRCLQEIAALTGANATQIYLFGYSGGAQFAHRYLMAHPYRVARAVVGSAGWYTFPDSTLKFPYGIRSTRKLPDVVFNPEQFLRVPVTVLVGERDTDLAGVRNNPQLDEQQGKNRVERARSWVAAMQAAAQAFGTPSKVRFEKVPDVGHSFAEFCETGALAERVFNALFEDSFDASKSPRAVQAASSVTGSPSVVAVAR